MSARARVAWLAAYAGLTFLAFPQPLGDDVLDLGLPLAFAVPACLVLGLRGLAPGRAARLGFLAGLAAHAAVLHWIYVVTVRYGNAWPAVGVVAVLALASYIAAFSALFGGATAWFERRGLAHPLVLACLWTAVDHLRSFAFSGFPWATLGYALHADSWLLGLAPLTGLYGLSFAGALGGASLAALALGRRAQAAVGFAVLVALHGLGAGLRATPPEPGIPLRVAALQGNIGQGVKWTRPWAERTLEAYEVLTRRAAAEGAQLVVWPETAVPGSPDADASLRARLAALAREVGVSLVVGAVGVDGFDLGRGRPAEGAGGVRYFDSAYVIDPLAGVGDRYDKTHRVPFGEYVPLRDLVGRFVRAVATGIASGDVTAGERVRALSLTLEPGEPELPVGVPICYELLFPDLTRRFAADGARVLLAVTNDAWYGRTGAPHQFLVMTAMRSAESRLWTARAANTGVSALIDSEGRVRARTRVFERDLVVGDVELAPPDREPTFYVRHGDLFAWACWWVTLGCVAVGRHRGRSGEQGV